MEIAYLADHVKLLPALAELHFAEWGRYRPKETLETRTARLRTLCGRRSIPTVLIAKHGSELLGGALLVAQDMASRPDLGPWSLGCMSSQSIATWALHKTYPRHLRGSAGAVCSNFVSLHGRRAGSLSSPWLVCC